MAAGFGMGLKLGDDDDSDEDEDMFANEKWKKLIKFRFNLKHINTLDNCLYGQGFAVEFYGELENSYSTSLITVSITSGIDRLSK